MRQRTRYSAEETARFAEALRAWRGTRDWTQPQAAAKIGVSARTYQDWERGVATPQAQGLAKLQDVGAPTPTDGDGQLQGIQQLLDEIADLRRLIERQDRS